MDQIDYLRGGMTRAGNGLVTPVPGLYAVSLAIGMQYAGGMCPPMPTCFGVIRANGTPVRQFSHGFGTSTYPQAKGFDYLDLPAGVVITAAAFQNTGGNVGVDGRSFISWLQMCLVANR
jgi:hypothetical protein